MMESPDLERRIVSVTEKIVLVTERDILIELRDFLESMSFHLWALLTVILTITFAYFGCRMPYFRQLEHRI